jgi:hypothetical protein
LLFTIAPDRTDERMQAEQLELVNHPAPVTGTGRGLGVGTPAGADDRRGVMSQKIVTVPEVVHAMTAADDAAVLAMAGNGGAVRVRVGVDLAAGHVTDLIQVGWGREVSLYYPHAEDADQTANGQSPQQPGVIEGDSTQLVSIGARQRLWLALPPVPPGEQRRG